MRCCRAPTTAIGCRDEVSRSGGDDHALSGDGDGDDTPGGDGSGARSAIERYLNRVTLGDTIELMRELPDGCAPLIVADPPYNLDKDFGPWKESERADEWLPWSKRWLDECYRLLPEGGAIFVYGIHRHLCWIQCYMYELGLTYRRQIIWHYENGFSGYKNAPAAHYEPLLWFTRGDGHTFHPIREPYKSVERLKHPITKAGKVWKPHPDGRLAGDVWKFPTLAGRRFRDEKVDHPTQKPLSISTRIIKHFSNPDDLVLVPFCGSGTEVVAAAQLGRRYVGFELNPEYVELARRRLRDVEAAPGSLISKP